MSKLRIITLSISLTSLSVLFTFLFFEGGVRLYEHLAKKEQLSDRPQYFYIPSDAKTFQDESHIHDKQPGVFRIAVLGDSFTFGPDMQFDDVFPKRIERMLNLNKPNPRAEVINYGVPGYSTMHEVNEAKRAVNEGSNLILLQITLNDAQLKPFVPDRITKKHEYGDMEYSDGIYKISRLAAFIAKGLHNKSTHEHYKNYYLKLFQRKGCWNKFKSSIREIAKIAKTNNVKLVAVVFPLFGLPLDETYPFLSVHNRIEDLLKETNVRYLDLLDAYKNISLERIQLIPGKDFHPNEIGHRIAAEHIYRWLFANHFIPPTLANQALYAERKGTKFPKERIDHF